MWPRKAGGARCGHKEEPVLKKRGMMGYVLVLAVFLVFCLVLSNTLTPGKDRRVTYAELLQMIQNDQVKSVAIRNTSLVGLRKDTRVAAADFPDRDYDFETTIGADFIETVRQIEATRQGKALDEISVGDLPFTVQYRAPLTTPGGMTSCRCC